MEEVESKALAILNEARALIVQDETSYIGAGEFILACKNLTKEIQAFFLPMKTAAFAAHRAVCEQENNTLKPVNQAMQAASAAALPWKQEQDRLAAAEAERRHMADVAARETNRLAAAAALEAQGKAVEAEAMLESALVEPRRIRVESAVPVVKGLSTQKKWKGRIVQPSLVNRQFCLPDQALINSKVQGFFAFVRDPSPEQIAALEAEIGGVSVFQEEIFAGRKSNG